MLELLFHLTAFNTGGQEQLALRKATEAAYIQTGLSSTEGQVKGGVTKVAKQQSDAMGTTKVFGYVGGAYQIYHTKTLSIPLSKHSTVSAHMDSVSVTFSF